MVEQTVTAKLHLVSTQTYICEQSFGGGSPEGGTIAAPWPFDKLHSTHNSAQTGVRPN